MVVCVAVSDDSGAHQKRAPNVDPDLRVRVLPDVRLQRADPMVPPLERRPTRDERGSQHRIDQRPAGKDQGARTVFVRIQHARTSVASCFIYAPSLLELVSLTLHSVQSSRNP
jgi:hypothetical protein